MIDLVILTFHFQMLTVLLKDPALLMHILKYLYMSASEILLQSFRKCVDVWVNQDWS